MAHVVSIDDGRRQDAEKYPQDIKPPVPCFYESQVIVLQEGKKRYSGYYRIEPEGRYVEDQVNYYGN